MATKKKLLQAAAGSAGGAGALNVEDVFSTYLYEGNGSSQVIENGINLGQSFGSGSGYFSGSATGSAPTGDSGYLQTSTSTDFALSNSDFTIEFFVNVSDGAGNNNIIFSFGAGTSDYDPLIIYTGITSTTADLKFYGSSSGTSWNFVSNATIGTVSFGTWHHVALVRSGSSLYLFLDGVLGSTTSVSTTSFAQSANQLLIGRAQNDKRFYGYLSDFHYVKGTALYTSAFTPPTSTISSVANTKLLTLQQSDILSDNSSSGHTVTEYDGTVTNSPFGPFDAADAGEGGLVWIKNRDQTDDHYLGDSERGFYRRLESNNTGAQVGNANGTWSFNANGFSIPNFSQVNTNGENYASWTFRKAPKFFDVVTYTGTGTNRTISHNLGSVPACIIVKSTSSAQDWTVYHVGTDATSPEQYHLVLNSTAARSNIERWNSTAPTSTEFTVGASIRVNGSGETYVAYLFAHNDGDGEFGPDGDQDIIKCGSWAGTGADGNTVDLGFEPQWILWKSATSTEEWHIVDNMRGWLTDDAGTDYRYLRANGANAEGGGFNINITSTGFEANGGSVETNASGSTYIYIAIRRGPMAVPESATDVFDVAFDGATDGKKPYIRSDTGVVDLIIANSRTGTTYHRPVTRLTSGRYLQTTSTAAEVTQATWKFDFQNGVYDLAASSVNTNGISWMWKRAPSFCDIVCYTGNGTAGNTISHNLGVAPEMMWVKKRSAVGDWYVYHSGMDTTAPEDYRMSINSTAARVDDFRPWNDTAPTDTVFSLGTSGDTNDSGVTYIAYLFASLDGVSKVGSYTGTGSDLTVDCGFSSGARFVLVKPTSTTGNWTVVDTERGLIAGNDPILALNDTGSEDTAFDSFDPNSSGFIVPSNPYTNVNGVEYIFYAIA